MLGLGRSRVVRVPVDGQGRMRPDALPAICRSDDRLPAGRQREHRRLRSVRPLIESAHRGGAWVHVDGAFGLWAKAAASLRHLARGLEARRFLGHRRAQVAQRAVRQRPGVRARRAGAAGRDGDHRRVPAAAGRASAIPATSRRSSRGARAASRSGRRCKRWAAPGIAEMIERNCRQARRFAAGLSAKGYAILNDVVLNQVLVSFGDDARTRRVVAGCRRTAPAGAASRSGRVTPRCASASATGRPATPTSNKVSRRCCALPRASSGSA